MPVMQVPEVLMLGAVEEFNTEIESLGAPVSYLFWMRNDFSTNLKP